MKQNMEIQRKSHMLVEEINLFLNELTRENKWSEWFVWPTHVIYFPVLQY